MDDLNQAQGLRGAEEMAAYRRVGEERDAALKALLTPEEFNRFMMNSIPPGTEMQRRVMGMERSEEHTSELQSRLHLVCRLLLEKKKKKQQQQKKQRKKNTAKQNSTV